MQWAFAKRYLLSRSSHSVINIIAVVSIVSVAVPVAAMVILLSVFNGFEGLVRTMYAGSDADIEICAAKAGSTPEILRPCESSSELILAIEGVETLSFIIEREALTESSYKDLAWASLAQRFPASSVLVFLLS